MFLILMGAPQFQKLLQNILTLPCKTSKKIKTYFITVPGCCDKHIKLSNAPQHVWIFMAVFVSKNKKEI